MLKFTIDLNTCLFLKNQVASRPRKNSRLHNTIFNLSVSSFIFSKSATDLWTYNNLNSILNFCLLFFIVYYLLIDLYYECNFYLDIYPNIGD